MEKKFESWSMGHGDVAIYTEDPELAKEIRKLVGRGSTYERARKSFRVAIHTATDQEKICREENLQKICC